MAVFFLFFVGHRLSAPAFLRGLILSLCILLAASPLAAEPIAGDFTGYPPSVRAEGMGGAFTALARGADGLLYNPAGLGFDRDLELVTLRRGLPQERSIETISSRFQFLEKGFSGISYQKHSVENLDIRDNAGNLRGSFDDRQEVFSFSQGFFLGRGLALGLTTYLERQEILTATASGRGMHAGLLFRDRDLSVGLVARHLGHERHWRGTATDPRERMPGELVAGLSLERGRHSFAADFARNDDGARCFRGGVETRVSERICLRAGLEDGRPTWGFGFAGDRYSLDVASSRTEFSQSWSVGLRFDLPEAPPRSRPLPPSAVSTDFVGPAHAPVAVLAAAVQPTPGSAPQTARETNFVTPDGFSGARRAYLERDWPGAVEALAAYLLEHGENGEAHLLMGLSLLRLEKIEEARLFIAKGRRLAPDSAYARYATMLMP